MLVAAAVCPCPPLLVPEVAAGAAPELESARDACAGALGVLAAARPDRLVVVGPPSRTGGTRRAPAAPSGASAWTSTSAWGAAATTGPPPSQATLPASLAVAAWLLDRAGWADTPVEGLGVGELVRRRAVCPGRTGHRRVGPSGWRCW